MNNEQSNNQNASVHDVIYNTQDYENAINMVMKYNPLIDKNETFVRRILDDLIGLMRDDHKSDWVMSGGFVLVRERNTKEADRLLIAFSVASMRDFDQPTWKTA